MRFLLRLRIGGCCPGTFVLGVREVHAMVDRHSPGRGAAEESGGSSVHGAFLLTGLIRRMELIYTVCTRAMGRRVCGCICLRSRNQAIHPQSLRVQRTSNRGRVLLTLRRDARGIRRPNLDWIIPKSAGSMSIGPNAVPKLACWICVQPRWSAKWPSS